MPLFLTIVLSHVVWIYLFSVLGVQIFGDVVRQNLAGGIDKGYGFIQDTDYYKLNYTRIGYGSFGEAIVATWVLVIVNNWHVIQQVYVVATGTKWVRLFFITFWMIDVVCTMAVLVAVLLEVVMKQWESKMADQPDKQRMEVEAKLKAVAASEEGQEESAMAEAVASVDKKLLDDDPSRISLDGTGKPKKGGVVGESVQWFSKRKAKVSSLMQTMVGGEITEADLKAAEVRAKESVDSSLAGIYKLYKRPKSKAETAEAAAEQEEKGKEKEKEGEMKQIKDGASTSSSALPDTDQK